MKYSLPLFLSDLLAIILSVFLAFLVKFRGQYLVELQRDRWVEGTLMALSILLISIFKGVYTKRRLFFEDLRETYENLFLSFILIFAYFALAKGDADYSRMFALLSFAFSAILIPSFRLLTKMIFRNLMSEDVLV